jgi:hypothetical protein
VLTGHVERMAGENAVTRRRTMIFAIDLDDLEHPALLRENLRYAGNERETESKGAITFL